MKLAEIIHAVPSADPAFVKTMEAMPEPPGAARDLLLQRLPELHRLFLEKRRIAASGDEVAWNKLVEQEAALIASII